MSAVLDFVSNHLGHGLDLGLGYMAWRLANSLKSSQATQDELIAKVVQTQTNHENRLTALEVNARS